MCSSRPCEWYNPSQQWYLRLGCQIRSVDRVFKNHATSRRFTGFLSLFHRLGSLSHFESSYSDYLGLGCESSAMVQNSSLPFEDCEKQHETTTSQKRPTKQRVQPRFLSQKKAAFFCGWVSGHKKIEEDWQRVREPKS